MNRESSFAPRLLRLVLIAAIVAAGSPHHHSGESSRVWDDQARELLRSSTSHPQAPLHVESVELERTPSCPVCLLRERARATRPSLASLGAAERPLLAFASVSDSVPLRRADSPTRPRGPPLV